MMVAALAQLFNELGKDINIPQATQKWFLDALLVPDLHKQP